MKTPPLSTTQQVSGPQALDIDAGIQPTDINAIGATGNQMPVRKLVFWGVTTVIVLVVTAIAAQHYLSSWFSSMRTTSQPPSPPAPSEQSTARRVQLPNALTPLEGPAVVELPTTSSPAVNQPPPAPINTAVPALIPTSQPVQTTPAVTDTKARYRGDTTLAPKSETAATGSSVFGLPAMGGMPPPPVSAAQLENRLKSLLTPTAMAPGMAANTNPILASGSTTNTPPNPQGSVGGMLSAASTPKAVAIKAFDPDLTIPKGDAIDCTMTTRVVTEISGFTSCVVSSPVYSANGRVLLIERMSEVQGEYTAVGQPGQRRVFVLWTRIRKPGGITIDIASPSTDPLGAAGMEGIVDNRWFERIGSAYMLSIFQDFLAATTAKSAGGSAGINSAAAASLYQNSISTSSSLAEKVLSQSINIKPTVYAHQGQRVSIYVARDLDFTSVYEIKPTQTGVRR